MVLIFLHSYIYVQWLLPCPVHLQSSWWVSALLDFKVSGYPKQHSDLIGNAGPLIHFSVNIFSFPLFPNLCVLSQAFWFVPSPSSAATSLSWESSGCDHKASFPAGGVSLHLCFGLTPHSSVVSGRLLAVYQSLWPRVELNSSPPCCKAVCIHAKISALEAPISNLLFATLSTSAALWWSISSWYWNVPYMGSQVFWPSIFSAGCLCWLIYSWACVSAVGNTEFSTKGKAYCCGWLRIFQELMRHCLQLINLSTKSSQQADRGEGGPVCFQDDVMTTHPYFKDEISGLCQHS